MICIPGSGVPVANRAARARRPAGTAGRPGEWVGWSSGGRQVAVPAQDRRGRDELPEAPARREQPGQGGDQGSVGPADPRSGSAPLEHSELVAQNQDLDLLCGVGSGAQHRPAREREEHEVDQSQRYRRIMRSPTGGQAAGQRPSQFRAPTRSNPAPSWKLWTGGARTRTQIGTHRPRRKDGLAQQSSRFRPPR